MLQRGRQLRPPAQRVGALAGFDLGVVGGDLKALSLGERGDGGALGFETETLRPCFWADTR